LTTQQLIIAVLVALAIGGLAWVFIYPTLSGEKRVEKRRESVARITPVRRDARIGGKQRRDQVEEALKDIEARNKTTKRPPLAIRISQAGLSWSKNPFLSVAALLGVFAFLAFMFTGAGILPALAVGFAAAFGLPLWILGFLKRRREAKFLAGFPDAVDIIVRGIKTGPAADGLP
jgi:tight adherence protein B